MSGSPAVPIGREPGFRYLLATGLLLSGGRFDAVRENLHVDVGAFVPAVVFGGEIALVTAGGIELEDAAIGPVLTRATERRVGGVIKPEIGVTLMGGVVAAHAPNAEGILRAAFGREIEVLKIDLPDAQ